MRRLLTLIGIVALAGAGVAALSAPAGAASPAQARSGLSAEALAEHQRIVDFWTPERRARAIPHDVVMRDEPTALAKGGNGGGGNKGRPGGGGGGTTTVTGATWTQGGQVTNTTGKVFFTIGSSWYVCSGSVVDSASNNTVLTAGHCVNDGNNAGFHGNWIFYPRYNGGADSTLGGWTATDLFTSTLWATTRNGFADDVGLATVVNPDFSNLESAVGGTIPSVVFNLGANQSAYNVSYGAFGYPAAGKYNGQTLTYCLGPVTYAYDGQSSLGLSCNMTGGSSGGPWFRGFSGTTGTTINTVTSYGYTSLKNWLFGPVFDAGEQNAFSGANTASGSCSGSPTAFRCTHL